MAAISTERPNPRRSRILVLAALSLAVSAGWAAPGRADLMVEVPNVQAAPGSKGSFDVLLMNAGSSSVDVAAFNVELALAGPPGVHFTGATIHTATPYIFQLSSAPPLSFSTFPNTNFIASDAEFAPPFFDTIAPRETVGLVHVLYSVDANAAFRSGRISVVPSGSLISDENAKIIPLDGPVGTFAVVPEPSTLVLLGFAGVILAGWRMLRRTQIPQWR